MALRVFTTRPMKKSTSAHLRTDCVDCNVRAFPRGASSTTRHSVRQRATRSLWSSVSLLLEFSALTGKRLSKCFDDEFAIPPGWQRNCSFVDCSGDQRLYIRMLQPAGSLHRDVADQLGRSR